MSAQRVPASNPVANLGFPLPASESFLHSTAALVCIAAAWHVPWVRRTAGPAGLAVLILGALLPMLDPLRFAFISEDQIAYLTQDPMFSGPLPALGLATLATIAVIVLGDSVKRCIQWWAWAVVGVLLPPALASLTPGGAPWLAPYFAHQFSWPILPEGNMWLIAILGTALAVGEIWTRGKKWVLGAAVALMLMQALAGVVGQLGLGSQVRAQADSVRKIEPDGLWPGRWLDVVVGPEHYSTVTRGWGSEGDSPSTTPRWNDQVLMLRLLEDPVLRRFYFEVFRHPVARIDATDSKIRLTMRELADALVDARGPTLVFETDAHGRHRQYLVERLD